MRWKTMNKRQAKKARKKVVYPLADEFNLLTLNAEELEEAIADYQKYAQKYCRYYHYRDREKLMRKRCYYVFPVGKTGREYCQGMLKRARKHNSPPVKVVQEMNGIMNIYNKEEK